ncbi:MAG TPA: dihydropteroate synthase [Candidatus Binatia bacterium]|nr:dihydropteroate synthase [Candidatus Binatia bacterium]
MTRVYLGLGSNLGDRMNCLRRAVRFLDGAPHVVVRDFSPVYETSPWGLEDQPNFLNMVVAADSDLSPGELLRVVKGIEQEMGRETTVRWGPRNIDIDVLFFGDVVVDEGEPGRQDLVIPHRGIEERAFVLRPLTDLAPGLVHPINGKTVTQMMKAVASEGPLRRLPLPLEWGWRTYVMGIVNVTPDSFSGDGLLSDDGWLDATLAQARQFVSAGADILDVGGESTRPGSMPVTADEELARVAPAIALLCEALDVPVSVDTYRASVAEAALDAGADWINDVWGLRMDPEMASLVAAAGCPIVLMHNRSQPKNVEQREKLGGRYVGIHYDDLIGDVKRELLESVERALVAGVERENIIVDPGIGFGKTVSQNLRLIDELDEIKGLGYPLLLGTSRKSFIGYTLGLPPEERVEGTAATVAIGIDRGADIVRVHDVSPIVRVARMTDRVVRRR